MGGHGSGGKIQWTDEMVKKLDSKFSGVIYKDTDGSIVPADQFIVFLAKDNAVPRMLKFYYDECVRIGAAEPQLEGIKELVERTMEWRRNHPEMCKVPDSSEIENR